MRVFLAASLVWDRYEYESKPTFATSSGAAHADLSQTPAFEPPPSPKSVFDSALAEWRLIHRPESLELHDLFLTDFKSQQTAYGAIFVDDAHTISVEYAIHTDPMLRSKFLAFYIGRQDQHTMEICSYLAYHFKFVLDKATQLLIEQKLPGESGTVSTKEAVFSGRIYVYHETYLAEENTVKLSRIYKSQGVAVIFRSVDYLSTKRTEATIRMLRNQGKH